MKRLFLAVSLACLVAFFATSQSAQSDSLFAKGVELYNAGKYKEAIPFFEECDQLDKAQLDSNSNRREYSSMWLASSYFHAGDTIKAKQIEKYYYLQPVDRRLTVQSDSLSAMSTELFNVGRFDEARSHILKCAEIEKNQLGKKSWFYGNSLANAAGISYQLRDSVAALEYLLKAEQIFKQSYGEKSERYVNLMTDMGLTYVGFNFDNNLINALQYLQRADSLAMSLENYEDKELKDYLLSIEVALGDHFAQNSENEKAAQYDNMAYELACKTIDKYSEDFPVFLLDYMANYNAYLGIYDEAVRLGLEALEIRKRVLGKEHPDYAATLSNLASYNSSLGNYDTAVQIGTEALDIFEKILGKEHPAYAASLYNLASYNSYLGNYDKAIRLDTEALEIRERVLGREDPSYAASLNNLTSDYSSLGNYAEALRFGKEALGIQERVFGKEHPEYAASLMNLAILNFYLSNYAEAIRLDTEALQIYEHVFGKEHPMYAASLNNLATYNSDIGNYAEAVRLVSEALEIRERVLGKEHPDYAASLHNLACDISNLGNYAEAVRLDMEALKIRERVLGKEHPEYATTLNSLADYNSSLGNYAEAICLATEALQIYERVLGKEHRFYATSLNNLALYNSDIGNYTEAIRMGLEASQIYECVLGKEHPEYAASLSNLAEIHFYCGNYNEAINYLVEYFGSISRIIRSNFAQMTEFERNMFWNKYEPYLNNRTHELAYRLSGNDILEVGYNSALLSKGVLLNTSQEMKQLILNSEDETILALYNDFSLNRLMLNRLYEKPIAERHLDTDSLEQVTNSLERELIAKSKTYGDYTRNMTINWHDVQAKLSPRDVCIEFVSFAVSADSTMYAAYLLKKDMAGPVLVPLFEQKQLPKADKLYTTSSMAQLVWKPLSQYLDGVDNIYFAPSGELYNIAIEYVPSWDGDILMSEKWNIHRLSSTRELALNKEKTAIKQSAIFGGIKYDTNANQLLANSKKYPSGERSLALQHVILADSLNMRDGVSELPETKIEAEEIGRTLSQKSVKSLLRTDTVATEGEFKHLSKQKINLMHIATHGFYWTEHEAKFYGNQLAFLSNDDRPRYEEDKALTRSGLLMAGANNALKGERLPEGVDDGILTAKEISQLELKDLDLVVLSACQTGLGEIKGDGVFGLQRGFKKAGANSIMMSLWKVDDTATRMLMTQFYKNLTSGMSKHESLKQAQKYLREYEVEVVETKDSRHQISAHAKEQAQQDANKEKTIKKVKKYQDPYYWAGFILLDALN